MLLRKCVINRLIMRYFVRSLKYFIFLCVLDVVLVWFMTLSHSAVEVDFLTLLREQLTSDSGPWLIVAFVGLAAFYPRFGFMRSRIEGCDIAADELRIMNAMQVYGFKLVERRGAELVYRKAGLLSRLMLMFEDEIVVRSIAGGVELVGLRRTVARVAYQLQCYMDSRRYEE